MFLFSSLAELYVIADELLKMYLLNNAELLEYFF